MDDKSRIDILIDKNKKKKLKIALADDEKTVTEFLSEKMDEYLKDKNFTSHISSKGIVNFSYKKK